MQHLDGEQCARIEKLAKDRGITCPYCGSAELRCEGYAHTYRGGSFGLDL